MAKIAEFYQVGDRSQMTVEKLLVIVENMYRDLAVAVNRKPDVYEREVDGQSTDTFLSNGDININRLTDKVEMLTNHTSSTSVTWTQLSP